MRHPASRIVPDGRAAEGAVDYSAVTARAGVAASRSRVVVGGRSAAGIGLRVKRATTRATATPPTPLSGQQQIATLVWERA